MSAPIVVIGAGGHGAVVADALLAGGQQVIGFTDSLLARHGRMLCGVPILGDDTALEAYGSDTVLLANGIGTTGDSETRGQRSAIQLGLSTKGWRFITVRHPTAVISQFAVVGHGAQLLASSVVQVNSRVGEGCIVNTSAVIEHDVSLEAWVHVAPGAVVCGGVVIGRGSHVGAGAVIRQGVRLGDDTVVAAGAVVVRDFAGGGMLIGVPARPMEHHP